MATGYTGCCSQNSKYLSAPACALYQEASMCACEVLQTCTSCPAIRCTEKGLAHLPGLEPCAGVLWTPPSLSPAHAQALLEASFQQGQPEVLTTVQDLPQRPPLFSALNNRKGVLTTPGQWPVDTGHLRCSTHSLAHLILASSLPATSLAHTLPLQGQQPFLQTPKPPLPLACGLSLKDASSITCITDR